MTGKIRQELQQVDWNSPKSIVNFYESNILYFNNINIDSDLSKSKDIIDVKLSFCYALIDLGHFTKCYDFTKILNIDLNRIIDKDSFEYHERYEKYLFAEGMVLSRLQRYDESQTSFKELIKIDPEKNIYKEWINGNRTRLLQKQINFLGWFGFGLVMLDLILSTIFRINFGKYTSIIGFIIMTVGFSLPYIIQWSRKLINN